jgi:hypothetical protein
MFSVMMGWKFVDVDLESQLYVSYVMYDSEQSTTIV